MNPTFGNAPELIIAIITLQTGSYNMVWASFIRTNLSLEKDLKQHI